MQYPTYYVCGCLYHYLDENTIDDDKVSDNERGKQRFDGQVKYLVMTDDDGCHFIYGANKENELRSDTLLRAIYDKTPYRQEDIVSYEFFDSIIDVPNPRLNENQSNSNGDSENDDDYLHSLTIYGYYLNIDANSAKKTLPKNYQWLSYDEARYALSIECDRILLEFVHELIRRRAYSTKMAEQAEQLFGPMRGSTVTEEQQMRDMIRSLAKPVGKNLSIYDL